MEERLERIEQKLNQIHQVLVGYSGHGGLLKQVEDLEERVDTLEKWRWPTEGLRALLAAVAGIFGGKWSG